MNAFFDLIEEVTREMTGSAKAVRWFITVEAGSARLHARPEVMEARIRPETLVRTLSQGMGLVERRAQRPRHFTDSALRIARDLASVPQAHIRAKGTNVALSAKTAAHVDRLLGVDIEEYGTMEGRLQTLSERRGPHFAIFDELTDQAIRCNVERERLDEAWRAFGRRVAVSGMIRYRKDGDPISIEAETIFVFPKDDELPTAEDVYGILGG